VVLESLSHALTAKLMHAPTHALSHARDDDREVLAQLLTRLYHIPRPE
jgi:glutamyl-tRNA reductase